MGSVMYAVLSVVRLQPSREGNGIEWNGVIYGRVKTHVLIMDTSTVASLLGICRSGGVLGSTIYSEIEAAMFVQFVQP